MERTMRTRTRSPALQRHTVPVCSSSGVKLSQFVQKLYQLVSDEDDSIIAWTCGGTAFQVKDPAQLENVCLPKYFRHSKFQSLVRQLNFYSFKKKSKVRGTWIYSHEMFQQSRPELLEQLKRKTNMSAQLGKRTVAQTEDDASASDDASPAKQQRLSPSAAGGASSARKESMNHGQARRFANRTSGFMTPSPKRTKGANGGAHARPLVPANARATQPFTSSSMFVNFDQMMPSSATNMPPASSSDFLYGGMAGLGTSSMPLEAPDLSVSEYYPAGLIDHESPRVLFGQLNQVKRQLEVSPSRSVAPVSWEAAIPGWESELMSSPELSPQMSPDLPGRLSPLTLCMSPLSLESGAESLLSLPLEEDNPQFLECLAMTVNQV